MRNESRAYVVRLLSLAALLLAVIALVNVVVDPFYFFHTPLVPGFNAVKTATPALRKASYVRLLRPRAVYTGNSRANTGIDPHHPGWGDAEPYNLTLDGASFGQMERYLEHALAVSDVRTVLMSLDFMSFNTWYRGSTDVNEAFLAGGGPDDPRDAPVGFRDVIAHLASADTLAESITTVRHQAVPEGMMNPPLDSLRERRRFAEGQRARFLIQEREYTNRLWFPPPAREFTFEYPGGGTTLDVFARALAACRGRGVDLRLFVSPTHARLSYAMYASGLLPAYEAWKRALVREVDEDARRHHAAPYPLWDFSGFNRYTTEPVPAPGDTTTLMRWYLEGSHYHVDLGDLVLDRIFGTTALWDEPVAPGFGVRLTPETIADQLRAWRHGLDEWIRQHPEDVAEIDAVRPVWTGTVTLPPAP